MRKIIFILSIIFYLITAKCYSQACPPPNGGNQGSPGNDPGIGFPITGVGSSDPNLIVTPKGIDSARWVARNNQMAVSIYFENDPNLATAPVHNAYIYYKFPSKQDATSFRVGSYGFNGMVFTVPPNLNFYQTRLDLRDSLGLYVDVTAGINIVNNTAFWIFQSIDPLTNLPPLDPLKGFLPVKDTSTAAVEIGTAKGEGFVNFTAKPANSTITRDTIFAQAKIVFDSNDTIATNIEFNTVDAFAPASTISANVIDSNIVQLYIHTADDANGCGVKTYDLYVAQDSGNYTAYRSNIRDSVVSFTGLVGSAYHFYALASDNVGSREALKTAPDKTVAFGTNRKWFLDADNDGFGNITRFVSAYYKPNGYVPDSTDCDDHDPYVSTGCTAICPNGSLTLHSNITGSNYQWQLNTDTSFANITDNSNYTGTGTATLLLSNIPSSWYGYDYRCVVNGQYSTVFSLKFTSTWTGAADTAWENPANWNCGFVPDTYTHVIIKLGPHQPVINSNHTCRSLRQEPGTMVQLNANYQLVISGPPQ
jgi:hypothetical protein